MKWFSSYPSKPLRWFSVRCRAEVSNVHGPNGLRPSFGCCIFEWMVR